MIDPPIIFEDDVLVVINKPAGVIVNRADTTVKVETVQEWAEGYVDVLKIEDGILDQEFLKSRDQDQENQEGPSSKAQIKSEFIDRGGIVHRLDKDTSGLLVVAKTPEAFENLKSQFKARGVVKKYVALVHGKVEPPSGIIDAPIERNPFNRMHFGVFPGGREAQTEYRTISNFKFQILLCWR